MVKRPQIKALHPVVLDEKGALKVRFDALYNRTKIQKRALAAKIFEIGLSHLEREAGK